MQHDDAIKKVLISEEQIRNRIAELGAQISHDYQGKDLLLVGILKGAWIYLADLVRAIDMNADVDFLAVSSYGNDFSSSGNLTFLKDLDGSCEGRHVLIVEDIVDSGLTLSALCELIKSRKAASVEVTTLLSKRAHRKTDISVKYVGFEIPDEFVLGYGLDYCQFYRGIKDICVLKESVYSK